MEKNSARGHTPDDFQYTSLSLSHVQLAALWVIFLLTWYLAKFLDTCLAFSGETNRRRFTKHDKLLPTLQIVQWLPLAKIYLETL